MIGAGFVGSLKIGYVAPPLFAIRFMTDRSPIFTRTQSVASAFCAITIPSPN